MEEQAPLFCSHSFLCWKGVGYHVRRIAPNGLVLSHTARDVERRLPIADGRWIFTSAGVRNDVKWARRDKVTAALTEHIGVEVDLHTISMSLSVHRLSTPW